MGHRGSRSDFSFCQVEVLQWQKETPYRHDIERHQRQRQIPEQAPTENRDRDRLVLSVGTDSEGGQNRVEVSPEKP